MHDILRTYMEAHRQNFGLSSIPVLHQQLSKLLSSPTHHTRSRQLKLAPSAEIPAWRGLAGMVPEPALCQTHVQQLYSRALGLTPKKAGKLPN